MTPITPHPPSAVFLRHGMRERLLADLFEAGSLQVSPFIVSPYMIKMHEVVTSAFPELYFILWSKFSDAVQAQPCQNVVPLFFPRMIHVDYFLGVPLWIDVVHHYRVSCGNA